MKQKLLIFSILFVLGANFAMAESEVLLPKSVFENDLKITEQEKVLLNEYDKTKPVLTPTSVTKPAQQSTVNKPAVMSKPTPSQLPNNFDISKTIGYFKANYEDLFFIYISELNNLKYTIISSNITKGRILFVANGRAYLTLMNSKSQNNFIIRTVPLDDKFNAQLQFIPNLYSNIKYKLSILEKETMEKKTKPN